jgi:hypothetical protein
MSEVGCLLPGLRSGGRGAAPAEESASDVASIDRNGVIAADDVRGRCKSTLLSKAS